MIFVAVFMFKGKNKVSKTTNIKKKKDRKWQNKNKEEDPCWVCVPNVHWSPDCPSRYGLEQDPIRI